MAAPQPATAGSSKPPSQQSDYLRQYGVHIVLEDALSALLEQLPHDPVEFLIGKLQERKQKQIPVRERLREVDVQKRLRHIYPLFLDKPVITQEGTVYAAFPLTDFYPPLMPHYLEDMADCLIYRSGLTDLDVDCVVSIASRGAGPLAHVCSQRLGVTYTLCNWYPEGSVGDIMVEPSAGFSGKGSIFLNSVVAGHRVLFVDDVLRTGHTSRSVMRAVKSVGATVVAALFVAESTGLGGRECLKEEFPDTAITTLIPFSCAGSRTTPDSAFAHNHQELLQGAERHTPAQNNSMRGDGLHAVTHYFRPLADYELAARLQTLLKTFVGIPIQATPHGYPYSNFCLTDFVPLMNPELVEHIADACYAFAKEWFDACDVIVSESDRGGGPMTHACALRAQKPYCLANWYSAGTDMSFGHKATVGYSGEGRIFVNGVSPGQKVVVVDDMLSSGGTAEGLFRCIEQAGGEIICSVFASEKINQKGRERLARSFPHVRILCLCSFNASGEVTTAGEPKFPVYSDSVAPPPPPRPTPVAA